VQNSLIYISDKIWDYLENKFDMKGGSSMSFASFDDMRDICLEFCEEEKRMNQKNQGDMTPLTHHNIRKSLKFYRFRNAEKLAVNTPLERIEKKGE
jgi:hypothetical protein